jgi:transcription termination/antitermination protein NusA
MRPEQLLNAVNLLVKEKHIDRETVFQILEETMAPVYKKYNEPTKNIRLNIDRKTGHLSVYQEKVVVEDVADNDKEISYEEATKIAGNADIGDKLQFLLKQKPYDRIFAQTVKQTLMQRITDEEKKIIYNDVKDYNGQIINGKIQRIDKKNIYVNIGKTIAILPYNEQIRKDNYRVGEDFKFFVVQVEDRPKDINIVLSRTHPQLVVKLFEEEISEIVDKTISIMAISRDPGYRTKIAIKTLDESIDPIGACVGQKGNRIQYIVRELRGEKIDIIPYSEDETKFIVNALRPATISKVELDYDNKCAKIIVEQDQLSLAIGKNGQNAKLAAKLTGWKIDIFTQKEYDELFNNVNSVIEENDEEETEISNADTLDTSDTATETAAETAADSAATDDAEIKNTSSPEKDNIDVLDENVETPKVVQDKE